ncbi:unnamed protein product, partial [Rotaria sp. Silwood1]
FFVYNPLTAITKSFLQGKTPLNRIEEFLIGNDLFFQLVTWLGYINSSVNPIIYAYSSREFRRAFIKYLCRCFPTRLRTFLMSYHNLHLLRYRCQRPSSVISAENLDSKLRFLTSYSHRNINLQQQQQQQPQPQPQPQQQQEEQFNNKPQTNILLDYCNCRDVSMPRVTCL